MQHLRGRTAILVSTLVFSIGAAHEERIVTVPGTGASQSMLRSLAATFEGDHGGFRVSIPDSVGSGGGIRAVGEGKAELARVARRPKKREEDYGLEYVAFARIPIVFATHLSADLRGVTTAQVLQLFSGRTANWSQVGGSDAQVRIITRYEGESTLSILEEKLSGWADITVTERSKITDTDPENAREIARIPGAIGYTTPDLAAEEGLQVLTLDGVKPQSPSYPLFIELGIVYKPQTLSGDAKSFIDYLLTAAAQSQMTPFGASAPR